MTRASHAIGWILTGSLAGAMGTQASEASTSAKVRVQERDANAPLSFEVNQGQTDGRVKFLSRGSGYTLFLTSTEAVLASRKAAVLRMKLVGAHSASRITGLQALPGRVNYVIGHDPTKWRTNIPTHAKVRYEDVYPGVDLSITAMDSSWSSTSS